MLKPGLGRTRRAYLWSYGPTQYDPMPAVVYDFADSRSGQNARSFLADWPGKLVCDDYSGYKALFESGVVEVGCMAHVRRKLHELHENQPSQIAADALVFFGALYDAERLAREEKLDAIGRQRLRQLRARPIADALREWLILHRQKVPDGSAIAKAIDYSLGRWEALTRYLDDWPLWRALHNGHIQPFAARAQFLVSGHCAESVRCAGCMLSRANSRLQESLCSQVTWR
jgi:transposase